MKKLFLTMLSLVCLFGASAETLTVCEGDAENPATNEYIPIYGYYIDTPPTKSQVLYPASELTAMVGKEITEMTFYASADITFSDGTQVVSLGEVEIDAMTGLVTEGLTQVFEGQVTRSGSQMTITFENPYTYTGGNLLLAIDITGRGTAKHAEFYGTATDYNSSYYKTNYGSPTAQQFLPKTTFIYGTPAEYAAKIDKESIAFGTSKLSELPKTETVTLRNMGANPFTPQVTFSNDAFSTTYEAAELANASSVDIPVVFNTSAIGEHEGTMTITAFEGEGGTFTVALTGNAYGGTVAPETIDFGSTPLNKVADIAAKTVTFTNYSGTEITPIVTATAPFGTTEVAAVADGATAQIPVTFAPDAKGEYNGTLTINAGAAGTYTVALTGAVGDEVYDITVCNGTDMNEYVPIYGYNYDSNTHTSQMIYPAEMLSELKGYKITSLTFYPDRKITITKGQATVSLMETEQTKFESANLVTGNFTDVATWVPSGADEALTLTFTTPYLYRGGNLMVQVDKQEGESSYQSTLNFYGTNQTEDVAYHKNSAYSNNSKLVKFLPKATFGYDPEQVVVYEIEMTPAGGEFEGLQNVKATVTPELPEGASIKYIFAEEGVAETPAEKDYPANGVDVNRTGKLTFILRDANSEELARTSNNFTINPLFGDLNGDGRADVTDVNVLVNIILGKKNPTDTNNE